MNSRYRLHQELLDILGSNNAYYQPPESIQINYPAIIYERSRIHNNHADNSVYSQKNGYRIIVVDKNPDSDLVEKVSKMDTAKFIKHYTSTGMNYDVFEVNYNKT